MRKNQQHENNRIDVQSKRYFLELFVFSSISFVFFSVWRYFWDVCFFSSLFVVVSVCCLLLLFSGICVTGVLDRCIKNAFVVTGGFASSVHSFRSIEADNVSKHNGQLKITSPTMQPKKKTTNENTSSKLQNKANCLTNCLRKQFHCLGNRKTGVGTQGFFPPIFRFSPPHRHFSSLLSVSSLWGSRPSRDRSRRAKQEHQVGSTCTDEGPGGGRGGHPGVCRPCGDHISVEQQAHGSRSCGRSWRSGVSIPRVPSLSLSRDSGTWYKAWRSRRRRRRRRRKEEAVEFEEDTCTPRPTDWWCILLLHSRY